MIDLMSVGLLPVFVGVFFAVIVVIVFVIFGFALYSRGEVVRVYLDRIPPYFPKIKRTRSMRLKLDKELIQSLTPEIKKILDGLFFTKAKSENENKSEKKEELAQNPDVPKELFESWKKLREDPSRFQIWCYRFNRRWGIKHLGVKGRTIYTYCFFSLEEMVKKRGRHKTIDGFFSDDYLLVHAPSLEQYIQKQVEEAELRGEQITPAQLKNLKKSYKHNSEETYLANLFIPTTLHVTEKTELMDRFSGFTNIFKIAMYALHVLGSEVAKVELLKAATRDMLKVQREMKQGVHTQRDLVGHKTTELGSLEDQLKGLKIPSTFSPKHEAFPVIPTPKAEPGLGIQFKKKVESTSLLDFIFWVMTLIAIIFGMAFTIFGGVLSVAGRASSGIPLVAIGAVFLVVFFVSYLLKKRSEPAPSVKPKSVEQPKEVES